MNGETLRDRVRKAIERLGERMREAPQAGEEKRKMLMSTCKSCGKPIFWARTTAGKLMPMDVEPHPDGNLIVDKLGRAVTVKPDYVGDEPRRRSHFVTCPQRAFWRGKGRP